MKRVLYLIIAWECILAGSAFPSSDTFLSVIPISSIPVTYLLGTLASVLLSLELRLGKTTSISAPKFSIFPE